MSHLEILDSNSNSEAKKFEYRAEVTVDLRQVQEDMTNEENHR